jgi:hypothetical protein
MLLEELGSGDTGQTLHYGTGAHTYNIYRGETRKFNQQIREDHESQACSYIYS